MARVVFLGTPQAAVPSLQRLTRDHDVGLVVTQPDRPKGRSQRPAPPPVKTAALAHGLDVRQPTSRAMLESVIEESTTFDVGVVVAYGRILSSDVLAMPRHGFVNVHFSLLPRWRGAAPVARALMAGDPMTGVTIMKLDEGLDTGPIVTAQAVDVLDQENAGQLTERLADLGGRLLEDTLQRYLDGELKPVPQTDEGVTYADKIESRDRPIDLDTNALTAVARVRGLAPSPSATIEIDGERHKILAADVSEAAVDKGRWTAVDDVPVVGLADGAIELVTVQRPGGRPQPGAAWLRGLRRDTGGVA